VENSMSPSGKTLSIDQARKIADLVIARLRKSELPKAATQEVIKKEGAKIADVVEADVTRRVIINLFAKGSRRILKRQPFNVYKIMGKGWSVKEQVSKRSNDSLDVGQITRKDYGGECIISGKSHLKCIKDAGEQDMQLDAKDFLVLWREKDHLTLKWLYETKGITWLSFWGTILSLPDGSRWVLYLFRNEDDGSWRWGARSLELCWGSNCTPAAVLANN